MGRVHCLPQEGGNEAYAIVIDFVRLPVEARGVATWAYGSASQLAPGGLRHIRQGASSVLEICIKENLCCWRQGWRRAPYVLAAVPKYFVHNRSVCNVVPRTIGARMPLIGARRWKTDALCDTGTVPWAYESLVRAPRVAGEWPDAAPALVLTPQAMRQRESP